MKTEKQIKPIDTVNVQIQNELRDELKIISIECGLKLKELTSKILTKFVKDFGRDKTTFTKLSL